MSLITRMRRQKAVWWARQTADAYGKFSYASPVEIDCRWDDETVEFRDEQGQLQYSNSTVYVDRVIGIGDMLERGELESATPSNPRDSANAHEVGSYQEIPNLRATETLRVARLMNKKG